MTAWDELQQWLMLNVGSKEAEECLALVARVVAEADGGLNMSAEGPPAEAFLAYADQINTDAREFVEMVGGRDDAPVPQKRG